VVLLALVGAGLGPVGWLAGFGYGAGVTVLLVRALVRSGGRRLGPADKVTLARSTLVGGVLALVVSDIASPGSASPASVVVLVTLASAALILDGVDGRVARRTGTVSALGARFDMEVDSMLILILSVHAVWSVGWWVLIIGAARFLFLAAGLIVPWMRGDLPFRYWAKVVAVVQGVVLTVVAAGILPRPVETVLCLAAAALLAESFGRSVWWLAAHRKVTDS
jgi:phosphatidylglycerophosphate synthase